MNENGVSICITAYNTQDYIKECLDSVVNQSWFKSHNDWEIIVGIDCCNKTLDYLKTIMHNYKNLRVFMMDSNKGTYITSNTIISNAKYENIFRFDSDDIMCSNLVETIMKNKGDCQFVRYCLKNFGCNTQKGVSWGPIYISKSLFLKYGGYKPWLCGADSELYHRLKKVEYIKTLPYVLMLRRVHKQSLTQSDETGMNSKLRKEYTNIIKSTIITCKADAIIECITNTYKEIEQPLTEIVNQDEYIKQLGNGQTSDEIVERYIINDKSDKNKKVESIKKLREDIQSGRIIKIPTQNGFVWKRVK